MVKEVVVGVDIGGTNIKSACVSKAGELIGPVAEAKSNSDETAVEIVDRIANAIQISQYSFEASRYIIRSCGIGMPGPFDYEDGVSRMEHKFAMIRGLNLKELLRDETGLEIEFINDAAAFGLGAAWKQTPESDRIIGITIGTGLGSSFIENGQNVENDPRVPAGGELWNLPYRDGIFEDYISARGIVAAYKRKTGDELNPLQISERARQADREAILTYHEVGVALGDGLKPIVAEFSPEKIIVGGKIARSFDLFGKATNRTLSESSETAPLAASADSDYMAIIGAAKHALMRSR